MSIRTPYDDMHIIPVDDLKEHVTELDCWCNPEVKNDDPPYIVIHHAADRREDNEPTNPYNTLPRC